MNSVLIYREIGFLCTIHHFFAITTGTVNSLPDRQIRKCTISPGLLSPVNLISSSG